MVLSDGFGPDCPRPHLDHRADQQIVHVLFRIEGDVMDPAVRSVDEHIVAVVQLVMESAVDNAPGDRHRVRISGIMDGVLCAARIEAGRAHPPVHGLDDVAALAGRQPPISAGSIPILGMTRKRPEIGSKLGKSKADPREHPLELAT